ncbi:hypothetical protein TD95_005151 [Thielaviopsis punctulata]|uniref:Zn(2)-C6 fungal-type domain-containing protein n=1 Tax=Thielaviopsis punctulata TaxID=72032 RepID=A0A0F4ZAD2_9PEZI|nr:hypothetical protein TD95_005151 [Thielaviopsis punctulata]
MNIQNTEIPADLLSLGEVSGDDSASWENITTSPHQSAINGGPFSGPLTPINDGYVNVPSSPHSALSEPLPQNIQLSMFDALDSGSPTMHTPNSDDSDFLSGTTLINTPARHIPVTSSRTVKNARITKKRKTSHTQPPVVSETKFLIATPSTMNPGNGSYASYNCFKEMGLNQNQRGRKGPLNSKTKEAALEVRRKGACFCCRLRKVKCGMERPCSNCVKLHDSIPQLMCWQFEDFVATLFPGFVREHFREDAVASFYTQNILDFTFNGKPYGLSIALSSSCNFNTQLVIDTHIFTPKDKNILQHWHVHSNDYNVAMDLRSAVPIGIDPKNKAQLSELAKKVKEYLAALPREPHFARQLTQTMEHSDVSHQIICMVQRYAKSTKSKLVDSALTLYGMQYVMSRQLSLTDASLNHLRHAGISIAPTAKWVTSRVLNRQVKRIIDQQMRDELTRIFKLFEAALKRKSRDKWAPCLAAFLILCLFMEAVEVALETYVMAEQQIQKLKNATSSISRLQVYDANQEIENMPFRKFVYQFHHLYQTYSKDASTAPFNPLADYRASTFESLDRPAQEFVRDLRMFISYRRFPAPNELDLLAQGEDASAPSEDSPFPRDVHVLYAGRLVSKFLLSFVNEEYITKSPPRVTDLR